jgi:hypothetical protein
VTRASALSMVTALCAVCMAAPEGLGPGAPQAGPGSLAKFGRFNTITLSDR